MLHIIVRVGNNITQHFIFKLVNYRIEGVSMGLMSLIITFMDPFGIIRKIIFRPVTTVVSTAFDHYRTKTSDQISSMKEIAVKASVVAILAISSAIVIWAAVFMYICTCNLSKFIVWLVYEFRN